MILSFDMDLHLQKELREEDKRYRAYLKQLKEEEEQKERELDQLCDLEVEKMWDKRIKQWKLEKAARRKLLEDVMAARRLQLQEKCECGGVYIIDYSM